MKKLDYLWMMLFAVFVSVGLVACEEDDEVSDAPQELFGTWNYYGETVTFNPDGTMTWTYSDGSTETASFSYEAGHSTIVLTAHGETDRWRIVTLNSTTLTVEDSYGERMTMSRVGSEADSEPEQGEQGGGELTPEQPMETDPDFDMSSPSTLSPVADLYPEISGKYVVSNAESGISYIEMLGNGHYLLRKATSYYLQAGRAMSKGARASQRSVYHDNRIETEDLLYGGFTKVSDLEYWLDGVGTLQVVRRNEQGAVVDFMLTDEDGESTTLTVDLEEAVGDLMTGNTALLCGRYWQLVKDHCVVWLNGKLGFDGYYYAEEDRLSVVANNIMANPDDFFDFGHETTMEAFFSPFGSYVFFNRDGSMGVALWRWVDEAAGTIFAYDVYEGVEDGGQSQLVFSEDRMTITSSSTYQEASESYVTLCRAMD